MTSVLPQRLLTLVYDLPGFLVSDLLCVLVVLSVDRDHTINPFPPVSAKIVSCFDFAEGLRLRVVTSL